MSNRGKKAKKAKVAKNKKKGKSKKKKPRAASRASSIYSEEDDFYAGRSNFGRSGSNLRQS